ncbi:hypothetical protein GALL_322020 [mine drainage metagenome]|uniref:Uncharacterized protein n=1 Tax=mine drainage metagenome TaxID=410659 RepID=A0A1J5QRC6_9ZZZZ
MRLVDDVNLVLPLHWREERLLAKITRIIDQSVRCCIEFHNIDRARAVCN